MITYMAYISRAVSLELLPRSSSVVLCPACKQAVQEVVHLISFIIPVCPSLGRSTLFRKMLGYIVTEGRAMLFDY